MAEPWYRVAFGAFYPCLYSHRDDDEARRCVDALARLAPLGNADGRPLLDLGCGDGRHLDQLRSHGLSVVGLDLSRALLQAARRRGLGAGLVCADMRRLPFGDGAFGAVLSLFTAFGYFGETAADGAGGDAAVIRGIARVSAPGGHWFLDFLNADRVRAELGGRALTRTREAGPLAVAETRRLEAGAVVKDVRLVALPGRDNEAAGLGVGPDGVEYTERVWLYTLADLDRLAGDAGLQRVGAAGDYDGAPLGAGPRWLLAYRKGG
ncbi:MAG: class I SAM-dependent methyltransferase [bacterium]|nr:class I SAM-dependent methyltransferase [bacterium]